MTQSLPESVVLHHHFKPQIRQIVISGSLLHLAIVMAAAVFVFCISNTVSAGSRIANTSLSTATHSETHTETNTIINLPVVKLDQTNPLAQTMEKIDGARVILVGETHMRWDHHLVQLEILKLLYQKSPKLAIGAEWFQRPYQKHLDAYVAGEISEQEMLYLTGFLSAGDTITVFIGR